MTEAEFAKIQASLGRRIHEHGGVFWEEVYPFYCKPAFVYRPFDPGSARPKRIKSLLGYSHQVRNPEKSNRTVALMVLDGNELRQFDIMQIATNKRPKIRKGLKSCEVRLLGSLETILERMREINIAQAARQEQGAGAETPVRRYTVEADAWRAQILREFKAGGREWWGAFVDGTLAAYMRTYQVDGIRVIEQTKADPLYYKYYPMDALYFTVLSRASADLECQIIINGRPQHPSLNHYKEQFCFRAVELPYYSTHARMVEWGKRLFVR